MSELYRKIYNVIIKALKETSKVGMIGDGVNDALAFAYADIAIAVLIFISPLYPG